ncbi:MAG TPA: branched-chain amino acid ABC transporter permease [Methylomirabilota bacterium]|jgi:branched-chain amino acid transport system permease protein|nr:branched-chain amino acid ABC transporter permease [Methylomirabilota bacterium]
MPSLTLLGQAVISGLLAGGLYSLLALGLSLSWGLLRLVNLAHFALAFLGAYLTYQLGTAFRLDPWLAVLLIVPAFFVLGAALHLVFARFRVGELTSLLVTFGITVILESVIQWFWTADFRRYETAYGTASTRVGPLFIPTLELLACLTAAGLAVGTWAWLRFTYVGKALRASAEDPAIAAAFGVNHRLQALVLSGVSAAYAGIAGGYIALISTLAPAQIWAWVGVVFAVVIIGGLANPIGALLAGLLIGLSESLTMAVVTPAWAPLVSFSVLICLLILRPGRV